MVALEPATRCVGVTVPLFSLRSHGSWGIGEIGDLPQLAALLAGAGIGMLQVLPINEIAGGNTSPYGALSAFAIDPMYITLSGIDDLRTLDNAAVLGVAGAHQLTTIRNQPGIAYDAVRSLKHRALAAGLARFRANELEVSQPSARAQRFLAFVADHSAWLADYALYRALKDHHRGAPWWDWPAPLRDREPTALAAATRSHAPEILYFQYVQWLAHTQWDHARAAVRAHGMELMGDLPFMVERDSADVWAERAEFRLDMSVGCPADQFDTDGQDWGLPPYHWAVMEANDFTWLRRRVRHAGQLFDRFRIDHLVGFFRTCMRPYAARRDAAGKLVAPTFDPPTAEAQLAHGQRVVAAMVESAASVGSRVIAEDLGSIPDYVGPALQSLGVPGYRVLIWEKDGEVFRDPATYPTCSVACFGTHDTAPIAAWWTEISPEERTAVGALPHLKPLLGANGAPPEPRFTAAVHAALLRQLCAASSDLVLLLMQDVLGVPDRINVPGTVAATNWCYRLPRLDMLAADLTTQAALSRVRAAIVASDRTPARNTPDN